MNNTEFTPEQLEELVEHIHRGTDPFPPLPHELVHEEDLTRSATPSVVPENPEHQDEPVKPSLYNQIIQMTVGQKIKLALKGNRDARNILIRDANRLVQRFVLQNPRVSDDEIATVARNRNVDSDILRLVGEHREWSKLPVVRSALVSNPKTPVAVSLRFVGMLSERELRLLAKSRNVQSAVVSKAKRIIMQRQVSGSTSSD